MKLSIAVFTRNHASWLPRILPQFRRVADELVVVVNDSTLDDSAEVARRYTDNVFLVEHEIVPEKQSEKIVAYCHGDWVLGMLDDETLSHHWEDRSFVESLFADRAATHYWIPRRWQLPTENDYIANSRWYPDYQMRLFRNIPSLIHYPGTLHSSIEVAGEPRYLANAWIVHWDLVWRERAAREAKVEEYRLATTNPLAEYYLYEEQAFNRRDINHDPVETFDESSFPCAQENPVAEYAIDLLAVDLPDTMATGETYAVTLAVRNRSPRLLKPSSRRLRDENVFVSYHWSPPGEPASRGDGWENPRFDFPARISSGETAFLLLPVSAPKSMGTYSLEFDIVEEGVAWFSEFQRQPHYRVNVVSAMPDHSTASTAKS